ncbi:50S ribosomal protein L11 methyltransferase [Candidatus Thioglobus sp.]|jgi:ribosomal protein L11 methyltransferase|uniref:50S ribosomal protein L11 methyltransferase n=1 Tax=Candidatus Thioglobus sp. TaxID=2026721 RepID=UPI001769F07D|nr:50S ribosomal protein L11 methyltransferase [Candidatus Thioglobus sp.]HIF47649.1 50S ribosomal protein L11 methyltransferase [Candidatus Thioglobus sp.]HIL03296.1 50S ribosomal protein L11 methyltransferase [Candidatus Thioglobus autotrophicus]
MDWMQLTLQTSKDQADFVSEILVGLDSVSVTFSDSQDDAIFEPPVGSTPLWQHVTITSLFDLEVDQDHIGHMLSQICNIDRINFELLKDRVWEDECKKDFHAMQFGQRIWICPSWEDSASLPDDAIVIDMDPGLAFGTGTHQTTDLCLQYLDANMPVGYTVIDYGSGTGILAIAAIKLGAVSVVAVDNDPQAVTATINNIGANQCQDQISVIHTQDEGQLDKVDLLIANILANPLVGLCEHFSNLVKQGGEIALSGILKDQLPIVLEAYGEYFETLEVEQKDDWCRVNGKRK